MIKVDDGKVIYSGDIPCIFIDLVLLLHTFMEFAEEEMSKEDAGKLLTLAGKFAVLDESELEEKFEDIVEEFKRDSQL